MEKDNTKQMNWSGTFKQSLCLNTYWNVPLTSATGETELMVI